MTYQQVVEKINECLKNAKTAVLATATRNGVVSCAQMCIVNDGTNIYFQTGGGFEKIKNIRENPYVALSCGNFNFKGTATILGHPRENDIFIKLFSEKYPAAYKAFTNLDDALLIKVNLIECKIWEIPENIAHKEEKLTTVNLINCSIKQIICTKQ